MHFLETSRVTAYLASALSPRTVLIQGTDSLAALADMKGPSGARSRTRIIVACRGLNEAEQRAWERTLTMEYADCGCDYGALSALSAAAGYGVILIGFGANAFLRSGPGLATGLGLSLGFAVGGKILGLRRARRRLLHQVGVLTALLRQRAGQ